MEQYTLILLPLQALRYSYFYVGQVLGTPQQILEQGRPQPATLASHPPPLSQQPMQQQQPLLLKPVPPPQPPLPNQHCSPSRPLQQIQSAPSPSPILAPVYQRHLDLAREQSNRTVKQEETEGALHVRLPYIVDKSMQSQVSLKQIR